MTGQASEPSLIEEACGSDPELRAEVESLLACYGKGERLLTSAIEREASSLAAKHVESFVGRSVGGLCAAVLVVRFIAGVDGLVQHTVLDGLDYLVPWWLAVLVLPAGLLCLWVGSRWTGASLDIRAV